MVKKTNPWIEIKNMRDEMDKIMNETMNFKLQSKSERNRLALWQPVADLYETGAYLVIEMELPGVLQENINLEIQGNQIMVFGEKMLEKEASGSAYQMLERSYGPFSRVFMLPDYIESSAVTAVFKNGVLRVRLPKKSKQKKPISIDIAER
jgi:HSP20 family protein